MDPRSLTESDFTLRDDPFGLFAAWLDDATHSEINDPNAVALGTVDPSGMPNVRMVLLKGLDARGFVFYTNFESAKGHEILSAMKAAMCFHWKSLRCQVRARGTVEVVADAEADSYFETRARGSRIGARVSKQSRPLAARAILEEAVAAETERFGDGPIPRPAHWSGFRLLPDAIEFWKDGAFRLHDRIVFTRDGEGWAKERLYP